MFKTFTPSLEPANTNLKRVDAMSKTTSTKSRSDAAVLAQIAQTTASKSAKAGGSSSQSAATIPAKRAAWMRSDELSEAAAECDGQLSDFDSLDAKELRLATKRRLKQEIDFISNVNFSKPGAGKEIF